MLLEPPSSLPETISGSSIVLAASQLFGNRESGGIDRLHAGLGRLSTEIQSSRCQLSDEAWKLAARCLHAINEQSFKESKVARHIESHDVSQHSTLVVMALDQILKMLRHCVGCKRFQEEIAVKRKQVAEVQTELGVAQVQLDEMTQAANSEQKALGISSYWLGVIKAVQKKVREKGIYPSKQAAIWALQRSNGNESAATSMLLKQPQARTVVSILKDPRLLRLGAIDLDGQKQAAIHKAKVLLRASHLEDIDLSDLDGDAPSLPPAKKKLCRKLPLLPLADANAAAHALVQATVCGDSEAVTSICKANEEVLDLSQPDRSGDSLLHQAVRSCDLPVVRALLEAGAIETVNQLQETPLHLACSAVMAVADQVSMCELDESTAGKINELQPCQVVSILLRFGATPLAKTAAGLTPLQVGKVPGLLNQSAGHLQVGLWLRTQIERAQEERAASAKELEVADSNDLLTDDKCVSIAAPEAGEENGAAEGQDSHQRSQSEDGDEDEDDGLGQCERCELEVPMDELDDNCECDKCRHLANCDDCGEEFNIEDLDENAMCIDCYRRCELEEEENCNEPEKVEPVGGGRDKRKHDESAAFVSAGCTQAEVELLRFCKAVCAFSDARRRLEPMDQNLKKSASDLVATADLGELERAREMKQLRAACDKTGIDSDIFPVDSPWSNFPWREQLQPGSDLEARLRRAIDLRDEEQLAMQLARARELGLSAASSKIFFEADELYGQILHTFDAQPAAAAATVDLAEGRALGKLALGCFLEDVDNSVPSSVPLTRSLSDVLSDRVTKWQSVGLIKSGADTELQHQILASVSASAQADATALQTEQHREQEQEKEQEQEQEQEVEMER